MYGKDALFYGKRHEDDYILKMLGVAVGINHWGNFPSARKANNSKHINRILIYYKYSYKTVSKYDII